MTISDPHDATARSLDALRIEIDRIDSNLHDLLMARGKIIDRLIAVKARQGGGSAFRPGREADMMRRLVTRHEGILPLDTVESIWRIIIATFTYVQSPYSVHADIAAGETAMRDSCRFHFGFTVPLMTHDGYASVIAAVSDAPGDLGIVPVDAPASGAWWAALTSPDAPKIIARLPFVERSDRAAGLPVFVVARPLVDSTPRDVTLYALEAFEAAHDPAVTVIARCGQAALIAVSSAHGIEDVSRLMRCKAILVGSHARRFEIETR